MDRDEILVRAGALEAAARAEGLHRRVVGVQLLLDWLETFPGATWQQRWLASGADATGPAWADEVRTPGLMAGLDGRAQLTGALGRMILGALRPSYCILYRLRSAMVLRRFRSMHDPEGFAILAAICDRIERFTVSDRNYAFNQLTRALMHNGGQLADITVDDCIEAYRAQVGYSAGQHSHWYLLLRQAGMLAGDSPPTIWAASRRGQLRVEELVDGYDLECKPVRDLLVEYLRLRIVRYGTHGVGELREDPNTVFMAVRAFYGDLAAWALEEPERWAIWAAPNPITGRDFLGQNKQRKRATARMHQRIRVLAPLLPALVTAADAHRRHTGAVLAAALVTPPGDEFTADGRPAAPVAGHRSHPG